MVKVQYCPQAYTGLDPGSLVLLRKTLLVLLICGCMATKPPLISECLIVVILVHLFSKFSVLNPKFELLRSTS